jgi:hypothetical protein
MSPGQRSKQESASPVLSPVPQAAYGDGAFAIPPSSKSKQGSIFSSIFSFFKGKTKVDLSDSLGDSSFHSSLTNDVGKTNLNSQFVPSKHSVSPPLSQNSSPHLELLPSSPESPNVLLPNVDLVKKTQVLSVKQDKKRTSPKTSGIVDFFFLSFFFFF